jgi:hypothetical protein
MNLVRLIKLCLIETYSEVRVDKYLSNNFPIQNGLKQRDALTPLLLKFPLEYAISKAQENQVGLKLNGTYQLMVYIDDLNLLENKINTIKKNTRPVVDASKEVGVVVNTEKTKYI